MITTNTTGDGFKPQNNIVWPFPNLPSQWVAPYGWWPYPPTITISPHIRIVDIDYPSHTELLEMLQELRDELATHEHEVSALIERADKLIERMGGKDE